MVIFAAAACAGAACAARTAEPQAGGPVIAVRDEASFEAALGRARAGTTIQLADGVYPQLSVDKRTFATAVVISGSRNVKLSGITFSGSTNLVLKGVTVTPVAQVPAVVEIKDASRNIVIDNVLVDGRDEDVGAFVKTGRDTSYVTVQDTELTNCGHGGGCVRPGARNLRVLRNRFYDCRSCTFIKGGGNGALVRGNTFDLAHNVRCTGGQATCPHNDLVHIMGGGPWTIVGNRFGDYKEGAAQVYANPSQVNTSDPIHDLLIASNIFAATSGGVAIRIGVGGRSPTPAPANIRIVNNTILSGKLTALLLPSSWDPIPASKHPLVANNILSSVNTSCSRARFVRNLLLRGPACARDRVGDPKLHASSDAPTPRSALVVNKADPRYAPKTDFYGHRRKGRPDIGAIELGGR
jgi:hypothetical protein